MRNNSSGRIAIVGRQPAIHDAPVPRGLWRKVTGFAIGLTAAIGLNMLVGPRSAVWRSTAISGPSDPASSAAAAPSGLEAKTSPVAGNPDIAPVVDRPSKKAAANKVSRSTKQHPR
jgi:hypothetical protein